jgi:YVTN family beta-propeller protein
LGSAVTVIDTVTNSSRTRGVDIGGHGAKDILFTLHGGFAYIANFSEGTVNVIDTATYQVNTISTAAGPRRLAISPGGNRVFVTNFRGGSVSVIDATTAASDVDALIRYGVCCFGYAITTADFNNNRTQETAVGTVLLKTQI